MKVEALEGHTPDELKKRTYLGYKLTHTCTCGMALERDFSEAYLSYPVPGVAVEVVLCCEGYYSDGDEYVDGCGAEFSAHVRLDLTLTHVR